MKIRNKKFASYCHSEESSTKNLSVHLKPTFVGDPSGRSLDPQDDRSGNGFTLPEILVVMVITAVAGTMLVAIFTNTLRGSNKSQILAVIKQNGQAALDNMDKTIRAADNVVCPTIGSSPSGVLAIAKNGLYTRFAFVAPTGSKNGEIEIDSPVLPATGTDSDIKTFLQDLCSTTYMPMGPYSSPNPTYNTLTDTNTQTGVSVSNGVFTRNTSSGFKDIITVSFVLQPGVAAPGVIAGQVNPVTFQTTVQLR